MHLTLFFSDVFTAIAVDVRVASFIDLIQCWIISLLCTFSSKSVKSDLIAVGKRELPLARR